MSQDRSSRRHRHDQDQVSVPTPQAQNKGHSDQRERGSGARRGGHGGGPGGIGRPVEKPKDFWGTLKRLLTFFGPRKVQLLTVFVLSVFGAAFGVFSPKIMGKATTRIFEGVTQKVQGLPGASIDFDYIARTLMTLGALYALSALFSYIQQFIMAGIAQGTIYDMRRDVNARLSRLPLAFFDSYTHGEILSRVVNDVDTVSSTLQHSLTQVMGLAVSLTGSIAMMLVISPVLTAIALVTLPLSVILTAFVATRARKYFAGQQKLLGELNGHIEEMYAGHRIVKAFGLEKQSVEEFGTINDELYDYGWKAQFISGIMMPLMGFINNIGYVLISVAGGVFVTRKAIELGDIQAFITYSRTFSQPVSQLTNMANTIQSAIAAAERVFELLDEPEETPDPQDARTVESPRGEVGFENVSFSYSKDVPLIDNMNIHVKPGQRIAIVGPTGAGKTTVVNLLMRFYDVTGGRITVDGIDIRDMKRSDLRMIFGMVLQDTWLFNGTIRENIAYGLEGATEKEIVRAARAAQADHFVRTLPGGYNTVIGEDGGNISQGQMQLLTIARAFLADPEVLILDEATSSVDTRTEIQVQKAMDRLMRGRTCFIIAHRLSTIRDASEILVMDNGSIIERGSHADLLAVGGFYADLYQSQFAAGNAVNQAV